ncbi:unnamed protein product [Closterium sp. Naga37s-1]|nr:unnamed protein product [Closterium sp. Naga37s-1]
MRRAPLAVARPNERRVCGKRPDRAARRRSEPCGRRTGGTGARAAVGGGGGRGVHGRGGGGAGCERVCGHVPRHVPWCARAPHSRATPRAHAHSPATHCAACSLARSSLLSLPRTLFRRFSVCPRLPLISRPLTTSLSSLSHSTIAQFPQIISPSPSAPTCAQWRAARERAARERLRDLAVFERRRDDPFSTSPLLAVKKFSRTLGAGGVAVPRDEIRPPAVLMRALVHLVRIVGGEGTGAGHGGWRGAERGAVVLGEGRMSESVYEFVSDRMRGMRQDMAMQRIHGAQAVHLLAPMVRFHAAAAYELATSLTHSLPAAGREAGSAAAGTTGRGGSGGGSSASLRGKGGGRGEEVASGAGRRGTTTCAPSSPSPSAVHRFDAHLNLKHLAEALRSLLFAFSTCRHHAASAHACAPPSPAQRSCSASSSSATATSGTGSSSGGGVCTRTGAATDDQGGGVEGGEAVDSWGDDSGSVADAEGVRRAARGAALQGAGAGGRNEEEQAVESWEEREEEALEGGQVGSAAGMAAVEAGGGGGGEEVEEEEDEEGEFTSLYVILHMAPHSHMPTCESLAPMLSSLRPSLLRSSHMRLALSLLRCVLLLGDGEKGEGPGDGNGAGKGGPLMSIPLHPSAGHHQDSEEQLQALCRQLGMPLSPLDATPPSHVPASAPPSLAPMSPMALVPREPLHPAVPAAGEGSGGMMPCSVVDAKRVGFRLASLPAPM